MPERRVKIISPCTHTRIIILKGYAKHLTPAIAQRNQNVAVQTGLDVSLECGPSGLKEENKILTPGGGLVMYSSKALQSATHCKCRTEGRVAPCIRPIKLITRPKNHGLPGF